MAINVRNNLIVVKGKDKTSSIQSWKIDDRKPLVYIIYNNGKRYSYNIKDVAFFKNPNDIDASDKAVLYEGCVKYGVIKVQIFDSFCRLIYKSGYSELCPTENIKIIESALNDQKCNNCFNYLKEIATALGLTVEDRNILAGHYEKIDFIQSDSVLASYLKGSRSQFSSTNKKTNIYPFGFNISQKQAVDNALNFDISVIEGPPGTGKTQTILNIIANAVMRGESVAVVSSNNSATKNVFDKLKKYGIEFIAAQLGSMDNKEKFLCEQAVQLPDMSEWREEPNSTLMPRLSVELDEKLKLKNELCVLMAEEDALKKEKAHFDDYYKTLSVEFPLPIFAKKITAKKILEFSAEYEHLLTQKIKVGVFKKILLRFSYGLKSTDFFGRECEIISAYCQKLFYERRLKEISSRRLSVEKSLKVYDFDEKMKEYSKLSMQVFRHALYEKYKNHKRQFYNKEDLRRKAESFINDYPVVLSTTYSLISSLSYRTCYDYVIIDEASQVDLVTGALALYCGKKAVIVGDLKQLPNVADKERKAVSDDIFSKYNLHNAYRFSDHSLLSSVTELFSDIPRVLLREHYRCHPEIIGFCNQRFYNNKLIVLTQPKSTRQAMIVYKTPPGNMARKHVNQRQIDVIKNKVIPEEKLNVFDGSVGIVTPYRDQANRLQEEFNGTSVKADTADKFQGQERSVIIFSTVDNEIGDFVSNPNRLNVAVSRAIDQFIVVTDGNDNDKASSIHELIEYIKYNNHEIIESKINSVFDYLYKVNEEARKAILSKYGRVSEYDSENLVYILIKDILKDERFSKLSIAMHTPLRYLLRDLSILNSREKQFASNHLAHVDFLISSRVTHRPVLVIEVDGFAYHNSDIQKERDLLKDGILQKYDIPLLRLSTIGSGEREKIYSKIAALVNE